MSHHFSLLLAAACALPTATSRAEDKPTEQAYLRITGSLQTRNSGKDLCGYCNGVVVFRDKTPFACFGLSQQPGGKTKYLYLLVLRSVPGPLGEIGTTVESHTDGTRSTEKARIKLGKQEITLAYQFTLDNTGIANGTPWVGGDELKTDSPRVFLVDLTKDKVTYTSVKATLPDSVPELSDEEKKSWPVAALKAVDQLRDKSPEIRKFLDGK